MIAIWNFISQFVAVLAGAFSGAFFAFLFQARRDKNAKEEARYNAAKRAQFIIICQHIWQHFLQENKNKKSREILIPEIVQHENNPLLDLNSIIFLTDEGETANILGEIVFSEHTSQLF